MNRVRLGRYIDQIASASQFWRRRENPLWIPHFNRVFAFSDWAVTELGSFEPDICLVHDSYALSAGASISQQTKCSLVFDAVEYPEHIGRSDSRASQITDMESSSNLIRAYENKIVSKTDVVLVGTRGVAQWYANNTQAPKANIVRNCLDFQELQATSSIRSDCGLSNEDRLVLYPNSVHPHCGIEETISALNELPSNIHLAIMGNVPRAMARSIKSHIRSTRLTSRVHILPMRGPGDLIEYRSGADVAVIPLDPSIPNHQTCLPNRFFEAIMSRLPVVVSNMPYVREVVEDHEIGVVAANTTPLHIAKAIADVIGNLDIYTNKAHRAAEILNWDTEKSAFISAFAPVLKGRENLKILCLADKSLVTNSRVYRFTRALAELGHNVKVMTWHLPAKEFRDDRITYVAMK